MTKQEFVKLYKDKSIWSKAKVDDKYYKTIEYALSIGDIYSVYMLMDCYYCPFDGSCHGKCFDTFKKLK